MNKLKQEVRSNLISTFQQIILRWPNQGR